MGSTINWSPQVKQLNLFSLPFLMPDYAAIDALVQGEVGKEMFKLIEKAGVVPLAWGENGYRQLSNSKREIKRPEDMKGMKLRVVGSPLYIDTFTALGANPTQMSWADAQPALASGAVDGQENPLSIYTGSKLPHRGPEVPDAVELRGRPADLRGQPGGLERLVRRRTARSCARPRWTPASSRSSSRARA